MEGSRRENKPNGTLTRGREIAHPSKVTLATDPLQLRLMRHEDGVCTRPAQSKTGAYVSLTQVRARHKAVGPDSLLPKSAFAKPPAMARTKKESRRAGVTLFNKPRHRAPRSIV